MESADQCISYIKPVQKGKGRKKRSDPTTWKKTLAKNKRHAASQPPQYPNCSHKSNKTYRCNKLKMCDIQDFHANFYSLRDKIKQDQFLLQFIGVHLPKRDKAVKMGSSRKGVAINYYVKIRNTKDFKIQVCQKAFLNILNISKDRVQRIGRNFLYTGLLPKERRGGAKPSKIYTERRNAVKSFIEKLKCSEVHYCREKSTRQYLPCDLSIKKLLSMYNNQVSNESLKVKRTFFRNIFCLDYNIGFGAPATDTCSKCSSLTEAIKREQDNDKRAALQIEKRIHKLKSKAFFNKLREDLPNMITFSFDCQKNLVNPKVQDQIAYYSRQLYTYNFTAVRGSSHARLNKDNVFIYTWMEQEYNKGSDEISSAVFHLLNSNDLSNYEKIRLCADGCGGQNRNSIMIFMCIYFLANCAPPNIKEIELVFPIRGHSFLPSDRVFGVIEKQLKKLPVITNPDDYVELFREHGTVTRLEDCGVRKWKDAAKTYLKTVNAWHFKFSTAKRFFIKKSKSKFITVTGEENYTVNLGEAKSVFKRGQRCTQMQVSDVEKGVPVKSKKVADIRTLLEAHYGKNWLQEQKLHFFRNFFEEQEQYVRDEMEDQEEEVTHCEGGQEDGASLRI